MSRLRDWFGRHLFPGSGPQPSPEPTAEWVHPYPDPYASGEHYRRRYATTPLFAETVEATGVEPDVAGKARPKPDPVAILNARYEAHQARLRMLAGGDL